MKVYDFAQQLAFSEGVTLEPEMIDAMANMVANATAVTRASEADDRQGTDYWIERSHGLPAISVDVKHRSFCPISRWDSDDACVETTSVYVGDGRPWDDEHRKKVGWSIDYSKRTDFVVYTWPNDAGTRFWIVPFVPFCKACRTNWRAWAAEYEERPAKNNGYLTLSVYPSRRDIARAIKAVTAGIA